MTGKRENPSGIFQILALASFVLPMIEPSGYTVTSFIINALAFFALFDMMLNQDK